MTDEEDEEEDRKAHKKPEPPTKPVNEVFVFTGIRIPLGKLVQLRKEWCGVREQISVWLLEFSDIDTVESE